MDYEGDIYRPPSEANSLIVQVTVGCEHNGCTFCSMYKGVKFRVKPLETVLADLREAREHYRYVGRIFFADGDVLCMAVSELKRLLEAARWFFPECTRVGVYSRASNILSKSDSELRALRDLGLGIVYIGAESGSDEVLRRINKRETAGQTVEAVQKAENAGIRTSVTFISGMGGRELMTEHAVKTGEMLSVMGASYAGFLTLRIAPSVPLYAEVQTGAFERLTPLELLHELEMILEHTNCAAETVLRSNHASNRLVLKGVLPRDKERLLERIRSAKVEPGMLRPEWLLEL